MDNDKKPMLEADNLTKVYEDGVKAVDNVSFQIYPGEVYAMLGGNGAGKTTTINLFLNLIDPTEGEARVDGIPTHRQPLEAKTVRDTPLPDKANPPAASACSFRYWRRESLRSFMLFS